MKHQVLISGLALALSLGATVAQAAQCPPNPDTGNRIFITTTNPDGVCWDYGAGNVPNSQNTVEGNNPTPYDGILTVPTGYTRLDKSDNANGPYEGLLTGTSNGTIGGLTDGLSGTFTITKPSTYQYLIIFKSGGTQSADPDWSAFLLPQGVLTGSWSISGQQALSHVELWGRNVVPIPAAAWLLGSGLLGLFAVGRRRKGAQVAAA